MLAPKLTGMLWMHDMMEGALRASAGCRAARQSFEFESKLVEHIDLK